MKLKSEDVCERLEVMLNILGEDKFLEITKMYGGSCVYIPKYSTYLKSIRNKEILGKYNGFNIMELAKAYDLSFNQIKRIVER